MHFRHVWLFCIALAIVVGGCDCGSDGPVDPKPRDTVTVVIDDSAGTFMPTGSTLVPHYDPSVDLLLNGDVLIAGGSDSIGPVLASPTSVVEIYSAATGTFSQTGSLNVARLDHGSTRLPDGRVVVVGGVQSKGKLERSIEIYDPATGKCTVAGALLQDRFSPRAITLSDGRVLIVSSGDYTSEIYDPTTGISMTGPPLPSNPRIPAITPLRNGGILFSGGMQPTFVHASAMRYDDQANMFTATSSMGSPRLTHTSTLLPDGRVLLTGGLAATPTTLLSSAEIYDPASGVFTAAGDMSITRDSHAAVLLNDSSVLIIGGRGYDGSINPWLQHTSAERYNPKTGKFTLLRNRMSISRHFHRAVRLKDGRVLIVGGVTNVNTMTSSAELFIP